MARSGALLLLLLAACARPADDAFSGTVQAPSAAVGSPVGGRVTGIFAVDGQRVRAQRVLVRFDDAQERSALAGARSDLAAAASTLADLRAGARTEDLARAQAQARQADESYASLALAQQRQIAILDAGVARARAQLADARAQAAQAQIDAVRAQRLFATGDFSGQQRDAAVTRAKSTRAQVAAASAGVADAREQLANAARVTLPRTTAAAQAGSEAAQQAYRSLAAGARPDVVRQAQANLAAARSRIAGAQARLDDTIVRAPADGVVNGFDLHVGDMVAAGAPVATIDEDGEPYVRVYVPQALLGRIRVGQHVAVRPDSQPQTALDGTVEQVDDRAQFTPQSVQTAEDRAELSFGVKVRIHDRAHPVHGGTTATVSWP